MVVFGGFRYKKSAVPHPFRSHPLPVPQDMEFLNDVRIFDLLNYSWHGVTKPPVDVSEKPSDNNSNGEDGVEEKVENSLATANTDDGNSALSLPPPHTHTLRQYIARQ